MNTSKYLAISIAALIAIAMALLVIQLLLFKIKQRANLDAKLKISYGIWFASLFFAYTIINLKTISLLSEGLNNLYKINGGYNYFEITKTISVFIGFAAAWFLLWFYISKVFVVLFTGKRKTFNEMESDNYSYFLIKGILLIGLIVSFMPIYEIILSAFIPSVQIPFYH